MFINSTCVGCSQCIVFCKHDAIEVFGRAEINDSCTKCAVCITYCPMRAIEFCKKGGSA